MNIPSPASFEHGEQHCPQREWSPAPSPMSASWLPTLGSGVQEDQIYILILRKLCLSSPGPFQPKGERKRRVSWAKKGNRTHTAQNQVMSLWALCTVATINTWKAFDSHISKTCHKAQASLFPQTGPHGKGKGGCHKGTIQPWQGRLDQASRVRHNSLCAETKAVTASDPSGHCGRDSWSIWAQKDSRNAWVKPPYFIQRETDTSGEDSHLQKEFLSTMCQTMCQTLRMKLNT